MIVTYSRLNYFSNGLSLTQLSDEISAHGILGLKFIRVSLVNTDVKIKFSSALISSEQDALDLLVSNHNYLKNSYTNIISIPPILNESNSAIYTRVGVLSYEGLNDVVKLSLVGYIDSGITNYSVRLFDNTNNAVLGVGTFSNTVEQIIELSSFSNIPSGQAALEVQVKVSGGSATDYLYINSIEIYLD